MEQQTAQTLIGQATEAEISGWKEKHPRGIFCIEVDGHVAYFKKPSRQIINLATGRVTKEKPLDYIETVMRETFIGGAKEVLNDDDLFLGAMVTMQEVLEAKKATLVNL